MLWAIIFSLIIIAAAAFVGVICHSFGKFAFIAKLSKGSVAKRRLLSLGMMALIAAALSLLFGTMNAIIIIIHLGLFVLISELIARIVRKCKKDKAPRFKTNLSGIIAIVLCFIYLTYGWIMAHNVRMTEYNLTSAKTSVPLKIIQITDSHLGTTFDGNGFAKHLNAIQAQNPDAVVLTGDFVDDDSMLEDMQIACRALGNLKTKYGVYFVFGNHDKGYSLTKGRGYTGDDLINELTKNGVVVLQDEVAELPGGYVIVGRQDRSEEQRGRKRASMEELKKEFSDEKYSIILDHQPNDYDNQVRAGVDLVLSGHTHGGNFFPIRRVGELIGQNDKTYGIETRENTVFIVSSGIADWASAFKTGCVSEYVVININP